MDLNELFPVRVNDCTPSPHDVVWAVAKWWNSEGIPGWQGFLETITGSEYSDISSVITLPFIMAPPSSIETVYTALVMATDAAQNLGLQTFFVTFDLPLYT